MSRTVDPSDPAIHLVRSSVLTLAMTISANNNPLRISFFFLLFVFFLQVKGVAKPELSSLWHPPHSHNGTANNNYV